MLIKPMDPIMDEVVNNVSALDISNTIYIHDVNDLSGVYSHNSYNNIVAKATQVIEAKIKGFPRDTSVESYMTGMENRVSFVKFTYYYDVVMSSGYKEFVDRTNHALFKLISATSTGFSTAKPIPDYYNRTENEFSGIEPDFTNSFSLTVYTSENNLLTTVGRPKSQLSHIRLDICEPVDFTVQELCETDSISIRNSCGSYGSNQIVYSGEDLVNKGPTTAKVMTIETRLSDLKNDEQYRNRLRQGLPYASEENVGFATEAEKQAEINELFTRINLRSKMRNLMVDMMKCYHLSTFREYTLVYRTGHKPGFRQAISPVNKIIQGYTVPQMEYIRDTFAVFCNKLENAMQEEIDIKYYINQHECVCRVYLLKSKCEETKRMINSESLHCFISESVHGDDIRGFKHDMDLDTIDYYSYHDENNYNISHSGKNL